MTEAQRLLAALEPSDGELLGELDEASKEHLMKHPAFIPLDVNWIEGKAGAQRLATALLTVNGQLLDSSKQPNFKRATYHVRVAIDPAKEQEFRSLMSGYVVETPWRKRGDS